MDAMDAGSASRTLRLKPGRETSVRRRHPWVFSGSLARPDALPEGAVAVTDSAGRVLGRGFPSPRAPIRVRLWSFGEDPLSEELVAGRVADAARVRRLVVPPETDGYRLVNAEGDGLPGLVVDRFAGVLVVQATTEGTERARSWWLPPLAALFPRATILQRNDLRSREGEGLELRDELLAGEAIPSSVEFRERGLLFSAEVSGGQKTGFFLDQRENRALVRAHAAGRRVLNVFSYSGAFGVAALAGGALSVTHVDVSAAALAAARANHERNGQDIAKVETTEADAFEDLRARVAARETWDLVVTDPPAFAR
jgi:23S rRNA (cytosine1962-C5)-methyltransferase